jgi:hypothetical protein
MKNKRLILDTALIKSGHFIKYKIVMMQLILQLNIDFYICS